MNSAIQPGVFVAAAKGGEHIPSILGFLDLVGIAWRISTLPADTFLPGVAIDAGEIVIDPAQFKHPGDLLHEAGHIAVAMPEDRPKLTGDIAAQLGDNCSPEMAVIPWSYAACRHLGLPPELLFHDEGYKGGSDFLLEQYEGGNPLGLPLLAWMGMCKCGDMRPDLPAFPVLAKWLRE